MTDNNKIFPSNSQKYKVGFDSLLEDVFGLNIAGLKSIWVLFKSPSLYFKAALLPEWNHEYTPSFRLWFGIAALTSALKFIWAGKNSSMQALYVEQMTLLATSIEEQAIKQGESIDFSDFNADAAAADLLKWMMVIMPFIFMFLAAALAVVYRAWGEKFSYVVRLRYIFAILITGNFLSLVTAPLATKLPLEMMGYYSLIGMLTMLGFYFLTAYRGAFEHMPTGPRWGRSIAITATLSFILMLSSVLAIMIAFVPTLKIHFPA